MQTKKKMFNQKQTKEKNKIFLYRNFHNNIFEKKNTLVFNENISNRYYKHYQKNVILYIIYKQNISNFSHIPKIQKITLNTMHKNNIINRKNIIYAMAALHIISMQKLKYTRAHKSIANFKLRKNMSIGMKVDLRNKIMYYFLEKLIYIILPKIKTLNKINAYNNLKNIHNFTLSIDIINNFPELQNYFEYFNNLQKLNVTLHTNIKKKQKKNTFFFSHNCKNAKVKKNLHFIYKKNNVYKKQKKNLLFFSAFQIPTYF